MKEELRHDVNYSISISGNPLKAMHAKSILIFLGNRGHVTLSLISRKKLLSITLTNFLTLLRENTSLYGRNCGFSKNESFSWPKLLVSRPISSNVRCTSHLQTLTPRVCKLLAIFYSFRSGKSLPAVPFSLFSLVLPRGG